MIIVAKFSSTCPCCSKPIQVGSQVDWSRGQKAVHVACAGQPARQTTAPAKRSERPFNGRRYGWDGVYGSSSYYSSGQYDEV